MRKVINLAPLENVRFGCRSTKLIIAHRKGKDIYQDYILIVLMNKENGREVVHPLTSFIYDNWKRKGYNTQIARAKHLVAFLNHIFFDYKNVLKINSLLDLTIDHGVHFLETKAKNGRLESTVNAYESTLTYFYLYLAKKGLLKRYDYSSLKSRAYTFEGNPKSISSIFKGEVSIVNKKSRAPEKIRRLADEHIIPFIATAIEVAPDIVLGIYICFFGGLRASEVLSIKRSEIKTKGVKGEHGLILKLTTDIKYAKGSNNRVKTPGNQGVQAYQDLLGFLYQFHLTYFQEPKDGSDSLLVDKRGNAMQYQTFRNRFNKVKDAFIKQLANSKSVTDKIYATNYLSLPWNSHIGRGTYSNLVAEQCNNLLELMLARRDSSASSALPYLAGSTEIILRVNSHLERMYEEGENGE
ncbi:site-specific integrase [Bacillus cereus]|uniref:site-specific integrase n=1 Tax=Bacillus cereus TaxID=1396 RepID=UPI001E49EF8E|nr:site-specific integrase [Bacillus cereus]MCU5477784.1 site-specific integrase [Bacillus cereus]MCU5615626.1 site-specific integrase [Bacillus cereus]